ncbi:hypothetical protein [Mycobacterium gordonae]|uniref:Uncharacterized protein n=1 Tax=Mycobacterium gordonae TaxID=1778 RepID=A0A1X1XCB6_MYCGO|nr:hypothetical protein [Mycobacterium gordonae]MCV7009291.1 hypothetical protein [Mycobacterium gordonae]ODR23409.1 hypothetical protein BHQ23_04785 [Mycobacterium gordonae]ORV96561.1 hypothetical protein AWC08_12525 [Mycobacterium gordonae]
MRRTGPWRLSPPLARAVKSSRAHVASAITIGIGGSFVGSGGGTLSTTGGSGGVDTTAGDGSGSATGGNGGNGGAGV